MHAFRVERLKRFYTKYRYLPSYQQMLKLFNVSSKNSVYKMVQKLIKEGLVQKEGNRLVPTRAFFALPYPGLVKAGFPTGVENTTDFLSLDEYLIENPNSSFLLSVSGDSLQGVGIYVGDMVVIDRRREAKNGDIVLAQIDREWTLKILEKTADTILLVSANPKYPPFKPLDELQLHGVVTAVIRKF